MASRPSNSTLSGSSYSRVGGGTISPDIINPGIRPEELVTGEVRPVEPNWPNYDTEVEDSFPASDPPSSSPMTGTNRGTNYSDSTSQMSSRTELPPDFKDNPKAQFEYGRRSEKSTEHFDPSSRRLETGNPDIGEVDLGTIEADRPAEPDDDNKDEIY